MKQSLHSRKIICALFLVLLASCKDEEPQPSPNSLGELKNFATFDLVISYLDDFDKGTQTFDLDDSGLAFISLQNKSVYKLKNGEAASHQSDIDFVYRLSTSGRTGYFNNTGYFKPSDDGYQKSPFGPGWTTWNESSLIAMAHSLKKDPDTGGSYSLSDEEFDVIMDIGGLAVVNFGDNVSVPLDDSNKLTSSADFDVWEDGSVDENNYFVFILANGSRGVFKVMKDDEAASLHITVKMAF